MADDTPKTKEYTVVKATLKDSLGNKCRQGETAHLTDAQAKVMLKGGFVVKPTKAEKPEGASGAE